MAMSPVEAYIRQSAAARGIDPDIAVRVAGHEGLGAFNPNGPDRGGDEGSSFGPFQLHYAGMSRSMPHAGLGDDFTRSTGLDARDPNTWRQQVDFALDTAKRGGWGPWMGAKAEGITGMMGINGQPGPTHAASVASPQAATDAAGPNQQPNASAATPMPAPGQPGGAMGPPNPPGWTGPPNQNNYFPPAPAPANNRSLLADMVSGGANAYAAAANQQVKLPQYPSMNTQNMSLPVAPIIDPQAAASQRQGLAQAMARLNAGSLYG